MEWLPEDRGDSPVAPREMGCYQKLTDVLERSRWLNKYPQCWHQGEQWHSLSGFETQGMSYQNLSAKIREWSCHYVFINTFENFIPAYIVLWSSSPSTLAHSPRSTLTPWLLPTLCAHLVQFTIPVSPQARSSPLVSSVDLPGVTPLEETNSSFLRSHQLSTVLQARIEVLYWSPYLFHVEMLMGTVQVMCRQPQLVWALECSGSVTSRRYCLTPVLPTSVSDSLSATSSSVVPGPWEIGMWYRCLACGCTLHRHFVSAPWVVVRVSVLSTVHSQTLLWWELRAALVNGLD